MQEPINQFDVVYPKSTLQDIGGRMISPDSQVVILKLEPDGTALVCRFGNYQHSVTTHLSLLSKWKSKSVI